MFFPSRIDTSAKSRLVWGVFADLLAKSARVYAISQQFVEVIGVFLPELDFIDDVRNDMGGHRLPLNRCLR